MNVRGTMRCGMRGSRLARADGAGSSRGGTTTRAGGCDVTWTTTSAPSRAPRQRRDRRQCLRAAVSDTAEVTREPSHVEREELLGAMRRVIDPDLGQDIVSCGFVKDIGLSPSSHPGAVDDAEMAASETVRVSVLLQLTTPACPVKEEFKSQVSENVRALGWVSDVSVEIASTALPTADAGADADGASPTPPCLRGVKHVIAVSSCKGGVGKSSVAVNLAYTLTMMGAKVGIFDADVYGPSLPIMVSPETRVLEMCPETKEITPVEYEGVKLVSFGFTTQGSAIMRGAMVSGLVNQLLTTARWGDLDYLVLDLPPGTGDIQLTIGQAVQIDAAVIVTTPQKLAFADVAKGIRMFGKRTTPIHTHPHQTHSNAPHGSRASGEGPSPRLHRGVGPLQCLPFVSIFYPAFPMMGLLVKGTAQSLHSWRTSC